MEKVSILEIFTKPLQVFGLQCFSLKSIDRGENRRVPSLIHKVKTVVLLVVGHFLGYFYFIRFHEILNTVKNSMDISATILNMVILYLLINGCVFSSFVKYSQMKKFFLIASNISKICVSQFNYKINYRKMRLGLCVLYFIFAFNMGFLTIFVFTPEAHIKTNSSMIAGLINFLVWNLVRPILLLMEIQFWIYVKIIDLNLKIITKLVQKSQTEINHELRRRKWITFRKIHMMIEEMVNCVNQLFGFLLFLRFITITFALVRIGHRILGKIGGPPMAFHYVFCNLRLI
jgi:hypothetical protein